MDKRQRQPPSCGCQTNHSETALSTAHLIKMRTALTRALSIDDVNQLGRETGQSERLQTVTPHRLFLSTIAALGGGKVESLADLLREFNSHNDVTVAYKAFYNRLAHSGFETFMQQMFARLVDRLTIQSAGPSPDGQCLPLYMGRRQAQILGRGKISRGTPGRQCGSELARMRRWRAASTAWRARYRGVQAPPAPGRCWSHRT